MQTVSDTYRTIWETPEHCKEYRVLIAGTEYSGSNLLSLRTYGQLFDGNRIIGNANAREIDLTILPKGDIPKQAEIQIFVRLTDGTAASEWIPKGVFFFSTRRRDYAAGTLTVHGYDALQKSEGVWLDESHRFSDWPMPVWDAVRDIAARMGAAVDPRTKLDPAFPVNYPVGADDSGTLGGYDLTMRVVLCRIAVANAGNWRMTDKGELLLLPWNSIPEETHYLIEEHGAAILFGGTRILI